MSYYSSAASRCIKLLAGPRSQGGCAQAFTYFQLSTLYVRHHVANNLIGISTAGENAAAATYLFTDQSNRAAN